MRAKVAKAIRREVYKDRSLRAPVRYVKMPDGSIQSTGDRRVYTQAKKNYRKGVFMV